MTNEQICAAILAIEKSDIKAMYEDLKDQEQENYKLCFNIATMQLYFCELPNAIYPTDNEAILCILTKNEILDPDSKSIITAKIKGEFGDCVETKI